MRRGWVPSLALFIALLSSGQARAQTNTVAQASSLVAAGFTCETRVYVYLDKSASLSYSERNQLAKSLGDVLQSSNNSSSRLYDQKLISIRSFAGLLGNWDTIQPDRSQHSADITKSVKQVFERTEAIAEGQSNIVNVLDDVKEKLVRLRAAQIRGNVFIIASDFVHDQTSKEDDLSRREDWDGWQDATFDDSDLWQTLVSEFRNSGEGNILLLLPLKAQEDPLRIGEKVLAKMKSLTVYDGQITEKGKLDLQGLLKFLKPLSIMNRVVQVGGKPYIEVTLEKHSCVNIPPLQVRLSPSNSGGYGTFTRIGKGRFRSKHPIPESQGAVDPENRAAADYTIHVELEGAANSDSLQTEKINAQEYIFLSELSLEPDDYNSSFTGRARFSQMFWHPGGLKVFLTLKDREKVVGSGSLRLRADASLEPKLVNDTVSIRVGKLLPEICYKPHWKDGRLKLEVKTEPDEARVQRELPVKIRNPDGEMDLLEDLAQQGSLPALSTLVTMLLMFAGRKSISTGTVEETTAVVGLFWLTLFLLMHHIPSIGVWMDILLSGRPASIVGFLICISLAGFIYMLLRKGAIGPSGDSAEIMLEVEKKASGIPLESDPRVGRLHRGFFTLLRKARFWNLGLWGSVLMAVFTTLIGFGLIFDPPDADCILEVVETIPVEN